MYVYTLGSPALDLTLVTNNEADFAGYPGLRLENWVEASA
jgi:tRNA(fMet)-specific endonuclease VapC